jgi:hypothetical protein
MRESAKTEGRGPRRVGHNEKGKGAERRQETKTPGAAENPEPKSGESWAASGDKAVRTEDDTAHVYFTSVRTLASSRVVQTRLIRASHNQRATLQRHASETRQQTITSPSLWYSKIDMHAKGSRKQTVATSKHGHRHKALVIC